MRNFVQPPPSMHCELCDGVLRFKLTKAGDPTVNMEVQTFVCTNCGHEYPRTVMHDRYAAHTASNTPTAEAGRITRPR
jgi:uncharacterized protein with PIN domain